MTAVLTPTDALRRDIMGSQDDTQINYSSSSIDWRAKYQEVADILSETRGELDEFHQSSKELEEELERDLERAEKAQQDLKIKVGRAEFERDDWKAKYMSLQTTHNTTTTSLQRELDMVRQENAKMRIQLRDLELGNDDLERNERAISSSLADVDAKYQRALEEKILLEHELLDKAHMEEECQRLKDQVREANEEVSILKDQLVVAQEASRSRSDVALSADHSPPATPSSEPADAPFSEEDLLRTAPLPDLQLSDLSPNEAPPRAHPPVPEKEKENATPVASQTGQTALLRRAGFQPGRSTIPSPSTSPSSGFGRSTTMPSLVATKGLPRTPIPRPLFPARNTSNSSTKTTSTTGGLPGTAARSKGVQMVSDMRARVRNLEARIQTRVPRLRMGSVSNNPDNSVTTPKLAAPTPTTNVLRKSAVDTRRRRSFDEEAVKRNNFNKTPVDESSGWVLIMEDSPSPVKRKDREQPRRASSPSVSPPAPSAFRKATAQTTTPSGAALTKSTNARSGTRLSIGTDRSSVSTAASMSSIPTPTSRPSTPTFLPLPTAGLYSGGGVGLKRSTGPTATTLQKRSSLGHHSSSFSPIALRPPSETAFIPRPSSNATTSSRGSMSSDEMPAMHNVTVRGPSKINPLSQSRIGRPSGGGRKSAGQDALEAFAALDKSRGRSGSTAAHGR